MKDNFVQILQRLPTSGTSSSTNHFGVATPFKVQVNFEIPIFKDQIDADAIYRWLNLLEGYFSVHDFYDRENIPFSLLKFAPMSNTGGKPTVSKRMKGNPLYSQPHPLVIHSKMASRNNITPWGAMRKNTSNGPRCGNKGINMCMN